ncbi:MAG: hypothetical protein R3C28_03975 [Pirellulaceae bacterium]
MIQELIYTSAPKGLKPEVVAFVPLPPQKGFPNPLLTGLNH